MFYLENIRKIFKNVIVTLKLFTYEINFIDCEIFYISIFFVFGFFNSYLGKLG